MVPGLPVGPSRVTGSATATAHLPVEGAPGQTAQHRGDAADRPRSFAIIADGRGVHAERTFTLRPALDGSSTLVVSDETQVGLLPRLGRVFLGPRLRAVNQEMFDDLARAAVTTHNARR